MGNLRYKIKAAGGLLCMVQKVAQIPRYEGTFGLRRRLAIDMGRSSWVCSAWICRYDSLTDDTRAKMCQIAGEFTRKLLISTVMPCYNHPSRKG